MSLDKGFGEKCLLDVSEGHSYAIAVTLSFFIGYGDADHVF